MCVCSLWMIGVAGQGLGLLAFPRWSTREGGREYVIPLSNPCSYRSVINPKESNGLELMLLFFFFFSGLSVYLGHIDQNAATMSEFNNAIHISTLGYTPTLM